MESLDLDQILRDLGGFGSYQSKRFVLVALLLAFTAFPVFSFIFTTIDIKHRCFVDGCDEGPSPNFHAGWARRAIPFKGNEPRKCLRYVNPFPAENCTGTFFNKTATVRCDRFLYEDGSKLAIANEFGIHCEEDQWKLSLVGTINNLGFLLGLPLTGFLSDRYGRLKIMTFSIISCVTLGLTKSFAANFSSYIMFEFFETFIGGGTYGAAYILGMELLPAEHRVMGSTLMACSYALGEALMGLLAWFTHSWRTFLRTAYAPGVLFVTYYWLLDESVRWLIANGQKVEAVSILKKIANENNHAFPNELDGYEENKFLGSKNPNEKSYMNQNVRIYAGENAAIENKLRIYMDQKQDKNIGRYLSADKHFTENEAGKNINFTGGIYVDGSAHAADKNVDIVDEIKIDSFGGVFKSAVLLARLLNCSFVWICCAFVYYGLTMHSVGISGNMYVNYMAVALIEIPAYIVSNFSLDRLGRKKSLALSLLLSGIACIGFVFTPEDDVSLRLLIFLLGKFSVTIAFTSVYLQTAEMFPTSLRHSIISLCSGFSRIGSMVSPQVLLLDQIWGSLPTIIFGAAALSAGLLSLIFPETLHTKLPDTLLEAENLAIAML